MTRQGPRLPGPSRGRINASGLWLVRGWCPSEPSAHGVPLRSGPRNVGIPQPCGWSRRPTFRSVAARDHRSGLPPFAPLASARLAPLRGRRRRCSALMVARWTYGRKVEESVAILRAARLALCDELVTRGRLLHDLAGAHEYPPIRVAQEITSGNRGCRGGVKVDRAHHRRRALGWPTLYRTRVRGIRRRPHAACQRAPRRHLRQARRLSALVVAADRQPSKRLLREARRNTPSAAAAGCASPSNRDQARTNPDSVRGGPRSAPRPRASRGSSCLSARDLPRGNLV